MYTGMRIATGSIKNILTYLLTYLLNALYVNTIKALSKSFACICSLLDKIFGRVAGSDPASVLIFCSSCQSVTNLNHSPKPLCSHSASMVASQGQGLSFLRLYERKTNCDLEWIDL